MERSKPLQHKFKQEYMLRATSFSFLIISLLLSCRGVRMAKTIPGDNERPHMLAIFMDGTGDKSHGDERRNTNVKKIHNLTYEHIRSLYVEGVGTGYRVRDSKYAMSTKERVMGAYRFLTENYQSKQDSICLFGFSRGANQCRILSSFIFTIGIIDLEQIKEEADKNKLLWNLYDLYVTAGSSLKKNQLATFINKWELDHPGQEVAYDTSGTTMIALMGLWDTVEALTFNDKLETGTPVPQHLNQLCNVKKLFHAVSLDDNRAFNYTPILATHKEVLLQPGQDINSIVEEVWFNGSHKDVGGGVRRKKMDRLSGLSLTWMWSRVAPYHIFKKPAASFDTFGKVNNMRANWILRKTSPGDSLRGIDKYWEAMNPDWNKHRIKVHRSVIARLDSGVVQDFKWQHKKGVRTRSDWYDWYPFSNCFKKDTLNGIERIRFQEKDCTCIEVVDDTVTTTTNVEH